MGCFKCGKCRVACPILNETKIFQSTNTGKKNRIQQRLDCTSDWLIYLVTCKKYKGQYIGKSKTIFKLRHSNHKMEIKNQRGGLGQHYSGPGGCGYENVSITLIEQVEQKNMKFLADRELYWQHQLRGYVENGHKVGHVIIFSLSLSIEFGSFLVVLCSYKSKSNCKYRLKN